MLILDFVDEIGLVKESKKRLLKKRKNEKNSGIKRYNINVNARNVTILEITEKDLKKDDVLTLLKVYKGRVLVPEKYKENENLKDYLYSPKEYYQRAMLSSLINQIKTINKEWKNICIKIDEFSPYKELYEIVRISKTVSVITLDNQFTEKFKKECYYEYGTFISVKDDESKCKSDVFLDLDAVDNNGRLMIKVKEKEFLLYPDMRYFENQPYYQILLPFNIEHNIICSAFSDK